jgi:hypothetical protein
MDEWPTSVVGPCWPEQAPVTGRILIDFVCPVRRCTARLGCVSEENGTTFLTVWQETPPTNVPMLAERKAAAGRQVPPPRYVASGRLDGITRDGLVGLFCPNHGLLKLTSAQIRDALGKARAKHKRTRLPAERRD